MNKEIKEILEEINKIIDNTSYNEEFTYFQTSHISKLLDYITNLQEENERLNNIIKEVREYIKEARESDSCTILPSGKITDIGYCLEAFEDIENLLNGKELKGSDKE